MSADLMRGLQVIQQLQLPATSGLIPQELLGKLPQRWEPTALGLFASTMYT